MAITNLTHRDTTPLKRAWNRLALACFILGWAWVVLCDSRAGRYR